MEFMIRNTELPPLNQHPLVNKSQVVPIHMTQRDWVHNIDWLIRLTDTLQTNTFGLLQPATTDCEHHIANMWGESYSNASLLLIPTYKEPDSRVLCLVIRYRVDSKKLAPAGRVHWCVPRHLSPMQTKLLPPSWMGHLKLEGWTPAYCIPCQAYVEARARHGANSLHN